METTVKDIAAWARQQLDEAEKEFKRQGKSKAKLYRHLHKHYGLSEFTVRNFHKGEKDNPTQNMLDSLVTALQSMAKARAKAKAA
jgi:hypothetical protein